jgi:glycosyltransferase involved in cell wall biosynthesis
VRSSDLVLCNSESSRSELLAFAAARSLLVSRTEVVRFGDGHAAPASSDEQREAFFLWVGTIERRKNLELLYDAVRLLADDGVEPLPTIVVAGAKGWGVGDLLHELELQSSPASRQFVLLGAVDDATLESLYRRARALLFPSHFEGWGLPVREGAIRGCPVAAGDSPAVREAADGCPGVVLLPSDDPAPWADYLRKPPPAGIAAEFRPWSAFVSDLLTTLALADGA